MKSRPRAAIHQPNVDQRPASSSARFTITRPTVAKFGSTSKTAPPALSNDNPEAGNPTVMRTAPPSAGDALALARCPSRSAATRRRRNQHAAPLSPRLPAPAPQPRHRATPRTPAAVRAPAQVSVRVPGPLSPQVPVRVPAPVPPHCRRKRPTEAPRRPTAPRRRALRRAARPVRIVKRWYRAWWCFRLHLGVAMRDDARVAVASKIATPPSYSTPKATVKQRSSIEHRRAAPAAFDSARSLCLRPHRREARFAARVPPPVEHHNADVARVANM